jgi:hypothetical protein
MRRRTRSSSDYPVIFNLFRCDRLERLTAGTDRDQAAWRLRVAMPFLALAFRTCSFRRACGYGALVWIFRMSGVPLEWTSQDDILRQRFLGWSLRGMAIIDQSGEVPAHSTLQKFFKDLGPGVITGAADDDPSGISTYSVTGATFGYTGLWTALFTFPLMAAVQLMCARLGMVTGQGLAAVIRKRYSRWILWPSCALLLIANIFNIGADLGGMADAMQVVTGVPAYFWTPLFACAIVALL